MCNTLVSERLGMSVCSWQMGKMEPSFECDWIENRWYCADRNNRRTVLRGRRWEEQNEHETEGWTETLSWHETVRKMEACWGTVQMVRPTTNSSLWLPLVHIVFGFPNNASKYILPQLEQMLNNEEQEALETEDIAGQCQQAGLYKTNTSSPTRRTGRETVKSNLP